MPRRFLRVQPANSGRNFEGFIVTEPPRNGSCKLGATVVIETQQCDCGSSAAVAGNQTRQQTANSAQHTHSSRALQRVRLRPPSRNQSESKPVRGRNKRPALSQLKSSRARRFSPE